MSRQRFVTTRLEPAIRSKSCPICLSHVSNRRAAVLAPCLHAYCVGCIERWSGLKRNCPLCNARFEGWFERIELGSGTFHERRLGKEERENGVGRVGSRLRSHLFVSVQRVVRRSREEFNCSNQRSRPLPRRRNFGKPGPESSDAVAHRILQWRRSIYEQRLQAVSHFSLSHLLSNSMTNNGVKEKILRRIEPWIRRELKAILVDPDPSIIVHVASSLYISASETSRNQSFFDDNYLEPLRPFLHGLINMFWHELSCFAASPFNMETYDSVVEYKKMSD